MGLSSLMFCKIPPFLSLVGQFFRDVSFLTFLFLYIVFFPLVYKTSTRTLTFLLLKCAGMDIGLICLLPDARAANHHPASNDARATSLQLFRLYPCGRFGASPGRHETQDSRSTPASTFTRPTRWESQMQHPPAPLEPLYI